jgi:hypothetical protein
MNTKLTLRMDDRLVGQAKMHAARRGKSVSQMFGEFVAALSTSKPVRVDLPPVTGSLLGIMKNQKLSETDYKDYLREKHS